MMMLSKWCCLFTALFMIIHFSVGEKTAADPCSCQISCPHLLDSHQVKNELIYLDSLPSYFYYDHGTRTCAPLQSSCKVSPGCRFENKDGCIAQCVDEGGDDRGGDKTSSGGCISTRFGCCPDGSPRSEAGGCVGSIDNAPISSHLRSVRWDMVATGLCVLVLLVAVLVGSGMVAYKHKHKQKEKIRSQYIHNVLEMYESESDSSDASRVETVRTSNILHEAV